MFYTYICTISTDLEWYSCYNPRLITVWIMGIMGTSEVGLCGYAAGQKLTCDAGK